MRLSVNHRTSYHFDPPMRGVVQSLRVWPSLFEGQVVKDWSVTVEGAVRGASFRDSAGDLIETATVLGPVSEVTVEMAGLVETKDLSGLLRGHRELVHPLAYMRPTRFTRPDEALRALAEDALGKIAPNDALGRAHALANAVREAIAYVPGETGSTTTAAEALEAKRGVCQDHTHALIAVALVSDIPARYVTGYLLVSGDEDAGEASHAWAELHVPDLGWIGFDASNGVSPNEKYIRLGSGLNARDAAPIRGVSQGVGREALDVDVSVVEADQQ
jgi:transglutaminase-like putative cysteine protease